MLDERIIEELKIYKMEIEKFIRALEIFSLEKIFELKQYDKSFFIIVSRHILFFKELYHYDKEKYHLKILISDLYFYIVAIIENRKRYIYLYERSIIENYMRYILSVNVEENHITRKLFDDLKSKYSICKSEYSLLIQEYYTSCEYIHGAKKIEGDLVFYFNEYLNKNDENTRRSKYYNRIIKILKLFDKIVIKSNPDFINGVFHRRKTILKYFLGEDNVKLLKQL
ncbi:hypothetical protein [Fusobacterium varium]